MKLELKHLVPYSLYGLTFLMESEPNSKEPNIEELKSIDIVLKMVNFGWGNAKTFLEIKPILRPLSDLIKEIEVNGEKFVPLGSLLVQKYPKWFQEHQGSKNYTHITLDFSGRFATAFLTFQATHEVQIDSTYVENTPYLIFKKLIEWHFDVFGLIEKGLAIDINTLNDKL